MSKATEDILAEIHGKLAEAMAEKLESGLATASDLNVIRQFLKDNGINSDGATDPKIKSLVDDLPDDLDNVTPLYGG
jgi:hypothetical protein